MTALQHVSAAWINALGWTLLHSLWQGAVISGALYIALKILPGANARLRYFLSFSALLSLAAWVAVTFLLQPAGVPAEAAAIADTPPAAPDIQTSGALLITQVEDMFPWLTILYFTGIAWMLLRTVTGLRQTQLMRRRDTRPAGHRLDTMLLTLAASMSIKGNVLLRLSSRAGVPMVIGILRPVILLPAAAVSNLSSSQLEAILLHELAHIKRHDYLLHIVQHVVETLLFFHPAVWMISASVRREREHCCDDMVIRYSRPYVYATALARLEEYRADSSAFALAATGQNGHLFNRIKRIMEMKKTQTNHSRIAAALCIATAAFLTLAWATPLTAQSRAGGKTTPYTPAAEDSARTQHRQKPPQAPPSPPSVPAAPPSSGAIPPAPEPPSRMQHTEAAMGAAMNAAGEALKTAQEVLRNASPEVSATVREAMADIDWNSISRDVAAATRETVNEIRTHAENIDWSEIRRQVEAIDWNEINREIRKGMEQTDWDTIREDVRKALESAAGTIQNQTK